MNKPRSPDSALPSVSPLLITESAEEFAQLRDAFYREINPRGQVEEMYVDEIVNKVWEILRLRRWKAAIMNFGFREALKDILSKLLQPPVMLDLRVEMETARLSVDWFQDDGAKKRVAKILRDFNLDESAIEAEAFRKSAAELEVIDRLLASSESRRNKALRNIDDYRYGFARQVRESSDRIMNGQVRALEHASRKRPSSAA
jgi:hypothetical protein